MENFLNLFCASVVGDSKVATVSQTKKLPLQQQSTTPPRPGVVTTNLITSNTRKIGRKYEIDLQKGPEVGILYYNNLHFIYFIKKKLFHLVLVLSSRVLVSVLQLGTTQQAGIVQFT